MSSSSISLNAGLSTTNTLVKKWYVLLDIFIYWLAILPIMISAILIFWPMFRAQTPISIGMYIFSAFMFFVYWIWFTMMVVLVSKAVLIVVNLIHKPREGVFNRDPSDKDYRFWSLRAVVKKPAIWAVHNFPLPWVDIVAFKIFGVKVKTIDTTLMDSWLSTEFLEIGKNCLIGSTSIIFSSIVIQDKLIIKKVTIGDNVVIGGACIVSPGTVIHDNVMLGARSTTKIGQELEEGWIYFGNPCTKLKPNKLHDELNYKATELGDSNERKQYVLKVATNEATNADAGGNEGTNADAGGNEGTNADAGRSEGKNTDAGDSEQ